MAQAPPDARHVLREENEMHREQKPVVTLLANVSTTWVYNRRGNKRNTIGKKQKKKDRKKGK